MKAAQIMHFGAPEALRITDTDRPTPGPGEVLVRVQASSINGHDVVVRGGGLKMVSGRKFPIGAGLDFAGVVVETGPGVADYRAEDRVWGMVHPRQKHAVAGAAEYVVVTTDRIGPAPVGISATEAASLVVTGSTALIALRDSVGLAAGERVLVRGAAGGVGTSAVQLARAMGGRVTALARDRHAEVLRELGAEEVLDYGNTASEQIGPFDVILDTVGTELNCYRSRLAKGGRMVTVGLSAAAIAAVAASTIHGSRRIRTFSANPGPGVLNAVADYVTSGALRPMVHHVYPLTDIAAAHEAFERGGVLGKHVLAIAG
ncbi:quinone oxidoreductase family protein [Nocardia alni]|uniref:quinone oxidoreductase family protein n=1 Tax=Nocardia alni TaxID=2815723 RepID=UPI001C23913C|nr:NADP-dependent oxidoreductase [Nocardia alni]